MITEDDRGKTEENRKDLSIIMPCRNEENTVVLCIDEARSVLSDNGIDGEIIVVDNASTDRSAEKILDYIEVFSKEGSEMNGCDDRTDGKGQGGCSIRLVRESAPGYGITLRRGMSEAKGSVIIMGDCDTTYDFHDAIKIYELLNSGEHDMVIGDRFDGGIENGAMPVSHVFGVKALSALAGLRFHTDVRDFHSGLRGFTRETYDNIRDSLNTDGMEFATEMIAVAAKRGLRIGQTPVKLRKCMQERKSKLRAIRDGLRHLGYIFRG
ncbi:MAG: glycosyltransferase family 2 protein [Lachnospiraceae bacterium]|nr:glycosyltransferase family 2 protein [Lachnospiraceae bacterium]